MVLSKIDYHEKFLKEYYSNIQNQPISLYKIVIIIIFPKIILHLNVLYVIKRENYIKDLIFFKLMGIKNV